MRWHAPLSLGLALLLAASAAASAATTNQVTGQLPIGVTGSAQGTIPCDIGPPVNAVPTEAQKAGLTHCVANFDFSQPAYAVPAFDPTGRAGSWANCFGENNDLSGIVWHGGAGGIRETTPCDFKQKIDPLDGSTVLNWEWRPTFGQGTGIGLITFNQYVGGGPDGRGLPTVALGNYYVETTARYETNCSTPSTCPGNPGIADVYMYPIPGEYGTEIDIFELQPNGVSAGNCASSNGGNPCWSNWQPSNPIWGISNYKNTDWHKYSALSTSDGKTDKRGCMYIDDILQVNGGCFVEDGAGVGQPDTTFLSKVMVSMGISGSNGMSLPEELNVKNIVVWSCANYQQSGAAGQCNGTTLSTSTNQNGQVESYYH